MDSEFSKRESILSSQYEILVDLYKFYLNLALQTSIFFYAITGGILSFYFSQSALLSTKTIEFGEKQIDILQLSLILPVVYSLLLGFLSFRGSYLLKKNVQDHIYAICNEIKLLKAPDMETAVIFLRMTSIFYWGIAIGITIIVKSIYVKFLLFIFIFCTITINFSRWYFWKKNN